jgi:hypothetical protein
VRYEQPRAGRGIAGCALAAALVALVAGPGSAPTARAASPGGSPPIVGIADDAPKYADDGGATMWAQLQDLGMREARVSVDFDPAQPRTIQEKAFLDRSIAKAAGSGIAVVFSVYPHVPRALATHTEARVAAFGSYLALLARTYPEVKRYIVLNEPNEGFFFAPQYSGRKNVSAAVAYKALAAAYDRLKAVDSKIEVIGLGLSPDGNGVTSTAPVRFLQALGQAYKASGRRKPIMDALAYHIHPRDSRTFSEKTHFRWPNGAPADLNRIKQAVWDAFHGTAQPTFAEDDDTQADRLRFVLAEVAVQVRIQDSLADRYTGSENVPVADEAWQAKTYPALMRWFACDRDVSDVMLFLLVDQQDLKRYQSGLLRIDGSKRPAFDSVKSAIPGLGRCGVERTWRHSERVFGARAVYGGKVRFPLAQSVFGVSVTAAEDATTKAGLFRVPGPSAPINRTLLAKSLDREPGAGGPVLSDTARIRARFLPRLEVHGTVARGVYRWVIRVRSAMNTGRTSILVGPVLTVG